jgi:hypothetical protein
MIPVWTEVNASSAKEALEKGIQEIEDGLGMEQSDQWLSDDYYVTSNNGETNELQMVNGEIREDNLWVRLDAMSDTTK